ncbi:MAG: hypothetical protein PHX70_04380 [Clostridium sp.]|nr:hypothetical protein [Clostridium sp.]
MKKLDKQLFIIVVIVVILTSTILIGYDFNQKKQLEISKSYKNNIQLHKAKKNIIYHIDSINLDSQSNICTISGWAIIKNENSYNIMPTLVLENKNGYLYKINTRITIRKDITTLYNGKTSDPNTHLTCETINNLGMTKNKYVYDNCGIISKFKINNLKKNTSYKIGIQLKRNNILYFIWTNQTLDLK